MSVQCAAAQPSQLINSSNNIAIPMQLPTSLAQALGNAFSVSVWINANWGSSAAERGRKSFVGIYGPASVTQGLDAVYFSNTTFSAPAALERVDQNINFVTATGGPPGTSLSDNNSIVWTGYWVPPTTGNYYFQVNSDDYLKLIINGVTVLNVTFYGTYTSSTPVATTAGVPLSFRVEYVNTGGAGAAQISEGTSASGPFTIIPPSQFQTSANPPFSTTGLQIGSSIGKGDIAVWTFGGQVMATTAADFNPAWNNQWINVCYTWDGLNHLIYVNGTQIASAQTAQNPGILKYVTINGYWQPAQSSTTSLLNVPATSAATSISLNPGTYTISWVGIAGGGIYDAYQFNSASTGNFRNAFTLTYSGVEITVDRNVVNHYATYATAALALSDFQAGDYQIGVAQTTGTYYPYSSTSIVTVPTITLNATTTLTFGVPDNVVTDNAGGMSLLIYNGAYAAETDNHIVDSYMLFGRILSQSEVMTISQAYGARHSIRNGLIAHYEFDESTEGSSVSTVLDLTGNGASLLMTGTGIPPKYSYSNSLADTNIRPVICT